MKATHRKKRILFVGEASFLLSGFSTYNKEVIKRLVATDKYEIAEFASAGIIRDPRDKDITWRYYANAVPNEDPRHGEYQSHPENVFGRWRFERVLLDFQPDIVHDIRDFWMLSYEQKSPLRPFFHLVWMPTVDSAPQKPEWIDLFTQVDGIFVYSEWAIDVLKKQSGNNIKVLGTASPGVDLDVFKPVNDLSQHRTNMGFEPDIYLVGTVMRNQKRKLFPDLFQAFHLFLQKCLDNGREDIAKKTFLYIHTSYPDVGWDLPSLIIEHKLGHKVICTYVCRTCKKPFCAFFQDARTVCPHCQNVSGVMSNVSEGLSRQALAQIMQMFDIYIQYAICLGKDEEVLTQKGWIPISQTKIGDKVWTHKGRWRKVVNIWKNLTISKYDKVKQISICGDYEKVITTENHPFYSLTKQDFTTKTKYSLREHIGANLLNKKNIPIPTPKPLHNLNIGDMLMVKIDDSVKDIKQIDLKKYATEKDKITEDYIQVMKHKYPRYITIDEEFCRFVGLFAADGSAGTSTNLNIKITSHSSEILNQELAQQQFNIIGNKKYKFRKYPNRNAVDIMLCSKLHMNVFLDWFKKHDKKQLPDWIINLPKYKQKEILIGLFIGDGHYYKKKNISMYSTISKKLADQIKHMLRRLRISYNCHKRDRTKDNLRDGKNRKPIYNFEIYGNIQEGEFNTVRNNTRNVYINDTYLLQIKSIDDIDYNDDTYNVEVLDDNSYTIRTGVTKNCEGLGIPAIESAACGIPVMAVDYSAMTDVVNNTQGTQLKVQRMFRELETGADRAMPDNDYLADQLYQFFTKPKAVRQRLGNLARKGAEKYYDWDKTAKVWENYFDSVELTGKQGQWKNTPPNIQPIPNDIPPNLSTTQFMDWIIYDVIKDNSLKGSFFELEGIRHLNYGATIQGRTLQRITPQDIFNVARGMAHNRNECETHRCNLQSLPQEDYIEYAHLKEKANK